MSIVLPWLPKRRQLLKNAMTDCSGQEPARSVSESTTMNLAPLDKRSIDWDS